MTTNDHTPFIYFLHDKTFPLQALSCADILGLHFLSVPLAKTSQSVLDPFYDALPLLKVHPSPSNRSATVDVIDSKCSDTFPW